MIQLGVRRVHRAQPALAKLCGFSSWRTLKAHIDALTVEGQLFDAARNGDVTRLTALLDKHPDRLHARAKPYEWSLLHAAAADLRSGTNVAISSTPFASRSA